MGGLSRIEVLSAILFWAVCAMAGALILMQRMEQIRRHEKQYGLSAGQGNLIGAAFGGLAGAGMAAIGIYFYLFVAGTAGWVEWTGRLSYVLILGASAAHLTVLFHLSLRLDAEDRALAGAKDDGTLSQLRGKQVEVIQQGRDGYADLKARDDEALEELMAVFGDRLFSGQRALSRIPFYGYLGTVCGILLMAEELTKLSEATETFKVLRDMAGGLVLAFQTTLVALLAYLPQRKLYDALLNRMGDLEHKWLAMRDASLDRRRNR